MGFSLSITLAMTFCVSSGRVSADDPPRPPAPTARQQDRLRERDRLGKQSETLEAEGKLPEAIAAAGALLDLEREIYGPDSEQSMGSLERIAGLHEARDDWSAAEKARREVLASRTRTLGDPHYKVADARFALAKAETIGRGGPEVRRRYAESRLLYSKMATLYGEGRFAEAVSLARQIVEIEAGVLGERHPEAITSLNDLGMVLTNQGDRAAARTIYERALKLRREVLGERHPDTIASVLNLALLLESQGELVAARPMLEGTLKLCGEVLGERHPLMIICLNNLALLLQEQGELAAARPIYERSLLLGREILGERHPDTITSLNNMAYLLKDQGDLAGARRMYDRALQLRGEVQGERHPDTITGLSNLASLLHDQGDLAAARPMYERVLALRREVLGERHPDTITSLNNLALLLQDQGDLAGARPMLELTLQYYRELLGERRPRTISSLNNLAMLLTKQGELAAARPMFERALQLRREVLGERHPDTISSLSNLGMVLRAQGDLAAAGPPLELAVGLTREVLGERHPDSITRANNLAFLLQARGDADSARREVARALEATSRYLARSLPILTGREQLALLVQSRESLDLMLSLSADRPEDDGPSLAAVLGTKGLMADADSVRRAAARPELTEGRARLSALLARLNTLAYARVAAEKSDDHARQIRELSGEVRRVEAELARAVGWAPRAVDAVRLASSIPEGSAMIDVLRYTYTPSSAPGRPRPPKEARYVAFVTRAGTAPIRVELGSADAIDEAVASWRSRLQQGAEAEESGRIVAGLVWAPLAARVGDARTILVAPDAGLCFLPWAALPGREPGSFLIRERAFGVIASARQMVALAETAPVPASGGLLAVGGVSYGEAVAGPVAVVTRSAPVSRSSSTFVDLPGTKAEAGTVASVYDSTHPGVATAELLGGAAATKGRLTSAMAGRRYLHLATHGYFAPPEIKNALVPDDDRTSLKSWEGMGRSELTGFHPGLLSGLAWAGAANPPANPATGLVDVGAGLMTAEEVGGLDLKGSELAVLSACETGLGRTAGGEGVLGLQRAFQQAGCRTVVASLWRVEDEATRKLMTRFYKNLWEKKLAPLEALRRAQISILDDPDLGDGGNPRLWAAWTLGGDPGGLPKLDPPAIPRPEIKQ